MKITVQQISKAVVQGTDKDLIKMISFLTNPEKKYTSAELKSIANGVSKYIDKLKYMGSQNNATNIEGILQAPNEQEIRVILTQWKEAEKALWEVTDGD